MNVRNGFTTVELLVVIGLSVLVGVIAVPVVRAAAKATTKAAAAVTEKTAEADKAKTPETDETVPAAENTAAAPSAANKKS